jgi:Ca2+-binding EF-hand superfamily protein
VLTVADTTSNSALSFALNVGGSHVTHDEFEYKGVWLKLESNIRTAKHAIEEVFKAFDKDCSGAITADELQQVSTELKHHLSPEELTSAFQDMDEDRDGKITLREFVKWWKKGRKGKQAWIK